MTGDSTSRKRSLIRSSRSSSSNFSREGYSVKNKSSKYHVAGFWSRGFRRASPETTRALRWVIHGNATTRHNWWLSQPKVQAVVTGPAGREESTGTPLRPDTKSEPILVQAQTLNWFNKCNVSFEVQNAPQTSSRNQFYNGRMDRRIQSNTRPFGSAPLITSSLARTVNDAVSCSIAFTLSHLETHRNPHEMLRQKHNLGWHPRRKSLSCSRSIPGPWAPWGQKGTMAPGIQLRAQRGASAWKLSLREGSIHLFREACSSGCGQRPTQEEASKASRFPKTQPRGDRMSPSLEPGSGPLFLPEFLWLFKYLGSRSSMWKANFKVKKRKQLT